MGSLEQDYSNENADAGLKGSEKDQVDVHGRPFVGDGSQAWIAAPVKAAVMLLIAAGSGLRRRGTLEERGCYVAGKCKTTVVTWWVSVPFVDEGDEEEDRDEEVEGGEVVIG